MSAKEYKLSISNRSEMEEKLLKGFPVIIEFPVAWGEMDAMGHVNNAVYFRYFESAHVVYFDRIKMWKFIEETGIGLILASTQCRFRTPLVYPDVVLVGARASDIGEGGLTMKYVVVSQRLSKIAAEGEGLLVTYDYRNNRKAPMPAEFKRSILDFEARGQSEA